MKRVMFFFAALALAGCDEAANTEGEPPEMWPDVIQSGSYWDWQLGGPFSFSRDVQVMDTDPDEATVAQIAALNARGVKTICYVSIGTVENYRDDVAAFPAAVVGRVYGDWPDERFLDIRQRDVLLPIMTARFQRCKDMGFDAIEPDNMDVHDNDSGFRISAADTVAYVYALAQVAHGMGLEIGQKNVPELTGQLVGRLDFVITEDCFADGWCGGVSAYAAASKDILNAEYTDTGVDWPAACAYGVANDVHMILKDRDLSAALQTCP